MRTVKASQQGNLCHEAGPRSNLTEGVASEVFVQLFCNRAQCQSSSLNSKAGRAMFATKAYAS